MNDNRLLSILSDFKNGHADISTTADLIQTQSSPDWRDVREELPKHMEKVSMVIEGCFIDGIFFTPDGMSHKPKKWRPILPGTDKGCRHCSNCGT